MENERYSVYVKTDEQGRITAINSSAFLSSVDGWVLIDAGDDDKFHHAQGNYLPLPLRDESGICRYRLVKNRIVSRSAEEMEADLPEEAPTEPVDTDTGARIAALEQQIEMLLEGVTEDE